MKNLKETLQIICDYMKEDCSNISYPEFVNIPKGIKQNSDCELFDFEYVDQSTGYLGDDHYGSMYFPFEDYYIKVGYST